MAVKIRLKRLGTKMKPHSRIIVCDGLRARDAREIANLGYYDPSKNPPLVKIDRVKAQQWLQAGAVPSDTVRSLLKKEGLV
ncbi:30S ribosomal protein S16 [Candidatus Omnitrophota bacterium]